MLLTVCAILTLQSDRESPSVKSTRKNDELSGTNRGSEQGAWIDRVILLVIVCTGQSQGVTTLVRAIIQQVDTMTATIALIATVLLAITVIRRFGDIMVHVVVAHLMR